MPNGERGHNDWPEAIAMIVALLVMAAMIIVPVVFDHG